MSAEQVVKCYKSTNTGAESLMGVLFSFQLNRLNKSNDKTVRVKMKREKSSRGVCCGRCVDVTWLCMRHLVMVAVW